MELALHACKYKKTEIAKNWGSFHPGNRYQYLGISQKMPKNQDFRATSRYSRNRIGLVHYQAGVNLGSD